MEAYQQKIGCFIHIPNVGRGQLKYVGPVDNKPGFFAGIDLLANIGKNDGTFQNKRYFQADYPQSGLFIQLPKVAALIENASTQNGASRRATLSQNDDTMPRTDSNGSLESIRRQTLTVLDSTNSPTPMRLQRPGMFHPDMEMEVDPPSSANGMRGVSSASSVNLEPTPDSITAKLIREYEHKLEKQERQIAHYKTLINDQRMVLEEIKPTMDAYEKKLEEDSQELSNLKAQLQQERQQREQEKKYYDTEHEQLLAVVEEYHAVSKQHAEQLKEQTANPQQQLANDGMVRELEELRKYKQDMELAKFKWQKEKDQLKLQNDSLNKEYQTVFQDLFRLQNELEQKDKKLQELEAQSTPANKAADTMQEPAKVSRDEEWCALCEKHGHSTLSCPAKE